MNRERIVELNMKEKWEKRKYWAYVCSLQQQQQYTYYFHSIIKFTVHSLIYKETKCCMVWHSILLRVSFNVVLICEFPTDLTVVIEKQPWSIAKKAYIDWRVYVRVCVHVHHKEWNIFFIFGFCCAVDCAVVLFVYVQSHFWCAQTKPWPLYHYPFHSIPFMSTLNSIYDIDWLSAPNLSKHLFGLVHSLRDWRQFIFVHCFFGPFAFLSR